MSFLLFNIPGWIFSRKFPAAGKSATRKGDIFQRLENVTRSAGNFPEAGKRHALRGKLSRGWKTPRAPRETFQKLENVTRSAGNFPEAGKRHALRGKLSQTAKTSRTPRETFANCEKTGFPKGYFSQRAKKRNRRRAFFRNVRKGDQGRSKVTRCRNWSS